MYAKNSVRLLLSLYFIVQFHMSLDKWILPSMKITCHFHCSRRALCAIQFLWRCGNGFIHGRSVHAELLLCAKVTSYCWYYRFMLLIKKIYSFNIGKSLDFVHVNWITKINWRLFEKINQIWTLVSTINTETNIKHNEISHFRSWPQWNKSQWAWQEIWQICHLYDFDCCGFF